MGNSALLNIVSHTEGLGVLLVACDLEGMGLASRAEEGVDYGRSRLHQVGVVASHVVGRGTDCRRAGYHSLVEMKVVVLDMGSTNDSHSSGTPLHGLCHHIDPFENNHRDFAPRLPRGPL